MQQVFAAGAATPISFMDIIRREEKAAPRIRERAVYRVLKFLIDTPAFCFTTYDHNDNPIFTPPPPIHQLPTGLTHATCQYMLDTIHVDEASYKGNIRCLDEFFKQLGFRSSEGQQRLASTVRVCAGDQMTMSRLRGLHKFRSEDLNSYERLEFLYKQCGFFHAQMSQETSLHSQYYGTRASLGLVHAFDLLNRKGLSSPSVKGTFHHDIKEGLYHVAEARFRDLWCVVGKTENLEDLRSRSPQDLLAIATTIVSGYASTLAMQNHSDRPNDLQDDLLYQSIQWSRDVLDYIDFNEAMSSGDVGRMEDQLPRLLFRFAGGGNSKYAIEILEVLQFLDRESTPMMKYAQ